MVTEAQGYVTEGPGSMLEIWGKSGEEKDHYTGPGQCSPEPAGYAHMPATLLLQRVATINKVI